MERCLCIKDGIHGGEAVYKDRYYLYMIPTKHNQYYTLYEENSIKNKYICSIYVHYSQFVKCFEVIVNDLVAIDIMFNDIMDGKVFV